jgi:1-acyl-sn-glycerol-3-phosphate acyltransferase
MTAFAASPVSCRSLTETTLVRLVCLTAFLADFGPRRRGGGRPSCSTGLCLLVSGSGCDVMAHFSAETKLLIVANHVSWLDIPVLGSLKPMSLLAKKEIGDHPAGWQICRLGGRRLRRSRPPFLLSVR